MAGPSASIDLEVKRLKVMVMGPADVGMQIDMSV